MFNKVLILSASAGAGHVRAGQALEKAFKESGAARDVRHIDTLQFTNALFRKLYADTYIELVNSAPGVLGWLYDRLDKPGRQDRLTHLLNKLNTGPFVRMLHDEQPDLTVCTHFLPSDIISRLKAKERMSCPLAVTVTDLDVHAMWLAGAADRYFVAIEESRELLTRFGVPAENITVSGIPIDPLFAAPNDAAAMRNKHGLHPDRVTILTSAGGLGVGPLQHLIASLAQLRHPAQVIAVCGKNEKLRKLVEKQVADLPRGNVAFKVLGFTTDMDELMAASDILVGKSGGLTTAEALARGLALCIVNPIPGQEERNCDHLLEDGCAIRCNNPLTLPWKIDALLDSPRRLKSMRAASRRLSKPNAAHDIVKTLLSHHS